MCILETGGPGKATDVVALYAPANADPATVLFVKYILGSQIPGYIGTGAGTYTCGSYLSAVQPNLVHA